MADPSNKAIYGDQSWLLSSRVKLSRAVNHYEDLDGRLNAYLSEKPLRLEIRYDEREDQHITSLGLLSDPPHALSGILGDVLGNLRAALDHMVWAMACQSHDPAHLWSDEMSHRVRRIVFPVIPEQEDVQKAKDDFEKHKVLEFLDPQAIRLLESLQPYHGTDVGRAIQKLHEFNNIDKHRLIRASVATIDLSETRLRAGLPLTGTYDLLDPPWERLSQFDIEEVYSVDVPLKPGTELHRIRFKDAELARELGAVVEISQPEFHLVFRAGGEAVDVGYFRWMIGEIGTVEDHVSQLFRGTRTA